MNIVAPKPFRPPPAQGPLQPIKQKGPLWDHAFSRWEKFLDVSPTFRRDRPLMRATVGQKRIPIEDLQQRIERARDLLPANDVPPDKRFDRWEKKSEWIMEEQKIWFLWDHLLNRKVLGKVQEDIPRVKQEQQMQHAWSSLPHVVRFYGGVQKGADRILIMEFASNTLNNLIREGTLTFQQILTVGKQLLEMYETSSSLSLMHGDLKPKNMAFSQNQLKVYDFGCAHYLDRETHPANTFQTLNYRAPEVILGLSYGSPADLWSIGCILFEMFTGRLFVEGSQDDEEAQRSALLQIIQHIGPPPSSFFEESEEISSFLSESETPSTPPDLRDLILNAAQSRGLSETVGRCFFQLLGSILCYEERLEPEELIEMCDRLRQFDQIRSSLT